MRKNTNKETIIGRVFSHSLEQKVTGEGSKAPGTSYIAGTVDVAVDEEGLNVVSIHYTYVTAMTKAGKANNTYTALTKIMNGKTWQTDGKAEAICAKFEPSIALNDFWSTRDEVFVAAPRNEGGFVTILSAGQMTPKATFEVDGVITKITLVEADPEKNIAEPFVRVHAAVFDFRNALLPFDFVVKGEKGIEYFTSLEVTPTEPIYTNFWGNIVATTVKETRTTESAFGEAKVDEVTRTTREWQITGMKTEAFEFGEPEVMTAEDLKKAIADREVYLAEQKKNAEEWAAKKDGDSAPAAANVASGGFSF